jgi:putative Ca2+/H+ antiporter (TMEM165/GDT1 family)
VPVVLFGDALTKRIPLPIVHRVAAAVFVILGLLTLLRT